MPERDQRIRLGLFVVAALIALGTLIVLFGKRPSLWSSRDRFWVQFDTAPNLQPGTPVRRSGVKIGEVDKVELEPSGAVTVEMLVDKRYPPRHNETPAITQSLLSGDAAIDLVTNPKEPNVPPDIAAYTPNETNPDKTGGKPIKGRGPLDIRATAEGARDLAQQTIEDIRKELKAISPELQRTLREYTALSEAIRQAIPEIQQTNDSVRRLADTTRNTMPNVAETNEKAKVAIDNWSRAGERLNVLLQANEKQISQIIESLVILLGEENQRNITAIIRKSSALMSDENIRNFNETLRNVKTFSDNLDPSIKELNKAIENFRRATQPFADNSSDLNHNLTYASAQLGLLAKDVRDFLKGYSTSDGTVQRLLTDPSVFNRANDALASMQRIMPKLELILEDLKDFSDKIARHPNSLIFDKNGGGLKGSPHAPLGPNPGVRPTPFTGQPQTTPPITIGPR